MVAREKDNLYYNFLDWQKKENEILVLTMYAFANIPIPQRFNIVFQVDNPDNFVETEYVITQAIINGWTSINQILRGHKHITVVEFANSIPDLCNLLSDFEDHTNDNKKIHLGFCDKEHFQTVKAKMKQSAVWIKG